MELSSVGSVLSARPEEQCDFGTVAYEAIKDTPFKITILDAAALITATHPDYFAVVCIPTEFIIDPPITILEPLLLMILQDKKKATTADSDALIRNMKAGITLQVNIDRQLSYEDRIVVPCCPVPKNGKPTYLEYLELPFSRKGRRRKKKKYF